MIVWKIYIQKIFYNKKKLKVAKKININTVFYNNKMWKIAKKIEMNKVFYNNKIKIKLVFNNNKIL